MVRFKSANVRARFHRPAIAYMLAVLSRLDRELHETHAAPYTGDLVVTSINDSTHGKTSRHYVDEAIDIRTHNFRGRADKRAFREVYEADLGWQFRVLLEAEGTPNEHLHAQVRKGHALIPAALIFPWG